MSRYLYKKIQNISPESLNFQHSGLKLTTLGADPMKSPAHEAVMNSIQSDFELFREVQNNPLYIPFQVSPKYTPII